MATAQASASQRIPDHGVERHAAPVVAIGNGYVVGADAPEENDAVARNRDCEDDSGNLGIDSAYRVVKDILDQITLNDSPPINEEVAMSTTASKDGAFPFSHHHKKSPNSNSSTVSVTTGSRTGSTAGYNREITSAPHSKDDTKPHYSRQRHVPPDEAPGSPQQPSIASTSASPNQGEHSPNGHASISSLDAASTLSSVASEFTAKQLEGMPPGNDTAALWMAQYQRSQTRAEMKMGNVALATLCIRTLDSLDASKVVHKASPRESSRQKDSASYRQMDSASYRQMDPKIDANRVETMASIPKESPVAKPKLHVVTDPENNSATPTRAKRSPTSWIKRDPPSDGSPEKNSCSSPTGDKKPWRAPWKKKQSPGADAPSPPGHVAKRWNREERTSDRVHDDLPPTPVRANRRQASSQFHSENDTDTGFPENGAEISNVGSCDSDNAVYTGGENDDGTQPVHEDAPSKVEPTANSLESPEAHLGNAAALDFELEEEVEAEEHQERFVPASSGDMEDITEETEDDIAEEKYVNYGKRPEKAKGKPDRSFTAEQAKRNDRPPAVQTISSPRFQMFGSEYARFLSSTPLAPASPKRKRKPGLRHSSARSTAACSKRLSLGGRPLNIEEANNAALTGAITDIIVTHGSQMPPKGYYRISQTGEGDEFTALQRSASHGGVSGLIPGRRTTQVFINVKKEPNWDRAAQRPCVTALVVIFPNRKEFVPPGFCVVRRYKGRAAGGTEKATSGDAADLNFGSSGERVYLCYRRSREGNPITGIFPLQPLNHETIPEGYTVMERTPRNYVADINVNAGAPVFLAFRQRLASLEPLRPLPLVLSVHSADPFDGLDDVATPAGHAPPLHRRTRRSSRRKRLCAYYCTGGTIVYSEVGKFHIMDRSTHSLLSPSSISHRLSLIEASRQRAGNLAVNASLSQAHTYASSVDEEERVVPADDIASVESSAGSSMVDATLHLSDFSMDESFSGGHSIGQSSSHSSLNHSLSTLSGSHHLGSEDSHDPPASVASTRYSSSAANVLHQTLFSNNDAELQRCLDVLSFIPTIETASDAMLNDDLQQMKLQARVAALTPILTSCYTHHGGSALIAVEGLTSLLTNTDFFSPDIGVLSDTTKQTSARLTLLDLATQAVCDVATSTSRETSFGACVDFVQQAVRYSQGHLNTRTIGYVLRFYLFVFYFGASVPTSAKGPNLVWSPGSQEQNDSRAERSVVALHDLPFLHEEVLTPGKVRYLVGGAPQASALALKELISLTIERLSTMNVLQLQAFASNVQAVDSSEPFGAFIGGIVSSLIDGAVNRVDMANYTQLALHQIHRSGGSELFWFDMLTSCGGGLFATAGKMNEELKMGNVVTFAILANLVKGSYGRIRRIPRSNELVPRDVASKLLSMELIQHFTEQWRESECHMEGRETQYVKGVAPAIDTMAFAVRRLVVPCLLTNTVSGLEDSRVFRRMMRIVSELWRSPYYRRHMKMEIGVLVSHFALGILRLGPQIFSPGRMSALEDKASNGGVGSLCTVSDLKAPLLSQQIDLLFEIKRWFDSNGVDAIEFYLNFDTNMWSHENAMSQMLPGTQWRLCQQLCGAVCTIAEQAGDLLGQQIRASRMSNTVPPPSPTATTTAVFLSSQMPAESSEEDMDQMIVLREGSRHLQRSAFEAITQILKSLAQSAATAMGRQYQALLFSWDGDKGIETQPSVDFNLPGPLSSSAEKDLISGPPHISKKSWIPHTPSRREEASRQGERDDAAERGEGIVGYWQSAIAAERRRATSSPTRQRHPKNNMAQSFGSRSDASLGAEASGFKGSANMLKSHRTDSERSTRDMAPGADEILPIAFEIARTKTLKKAVDYLIACDFLTPSPRDVAAFLRLHRAQLDPAPLGVYLGEGGNGGVEVEYWNQIRFNYFRPISFVGMNVEEGLRHFLTNCGFRLPGEAQQIDRIMTTFAQCYWEDNAGDLSKCPFKDQDTVFLIAFAIIMLNTDLHKSHGSTASSRKQRKKMTKHEFLNNLRGVDVNEDLSRDYLSEIYDSIEARPITLLITIGDNSDSGSLHTENQELTGEQLGLEASLQAMLKNAKSSEELLRGVSVHDHPFYTVEDLSRSLLYEGDLDALADMARSVLATTWHHYHGLIHSVLDAAHLDPRGMEMSVDLLQYALCTTICLDMTMERAAFMTQLARFKTFRERRGTWLSSEDHQTYKLADWYIQMETNCADPANDEAKLCALVDVHDLIQELHDSLRIDVDAKRMMNCVVRRIRHGEFLLNDPTRFFLREGDLGKRGHRLGRNTKYRFFLFSDVLIYTKASSSGDDFKIQEELPLHLMKITDWFPDKRQQMKTAFQIHHPRKSFIVFAESVEERQSWVKDLRSAIEREVERLAHIESARLAAASVGGER